MSLMTLSLITVVCYLLASAVWWVAADRLSQAKSVMFVFGFVAILLHSFLLHRWIDITAGQNLTFFNMLSLTLWLVSLYVLVMSLFKPLELIVSFLFPVTVVSIILVLLFPSSFIVHTAKNPEALFHILLSILTLSVLCCAGLFAIFLALQERLLHLRRASKLLRHLPPLESMEVILFQVLVFGFVLLTLVLATALYFYYPILWHNRFLLPKTAIVVGAWFIFAVLLVGRYRWGWRGRKAITYTLIGVGLLILAYFGSKFVLEALT